MILGYVVMPLPFYITEVVLDVHWQFSTKIVTLFYCIGGFLPFLFSTFQFLPTPHYFSIFLFGVWNICLESFHLCSPYYKPWCTLYPFYGQFVGWPGCFIPKRLTNPTIMACSRYHYFSILSFNPLNLVVRAQSTISVFLLLYFLLLLLPFLIFFIFSYLFCSFLIPSYTPFYYIYFIPFFFSFSFHDWPDSSATNLLTQHLRL